MSRSSEALAISKPGDNGYSEASQHQANINSPLSGLSVADNRSSEEEVSINLNSLLAPLAVVDNRKGESETYFAFEEANTDGIAHFKSMGSNCIGLEDLRGGGDNDLMISSFISVTLCSLLKIALLAKETDLKTERSQKNETLGRRADQ